MRTLGFAAALVANSFAAVAAQEQSQEKGKASAAGANSDVEKKNEVVFSKEPTIGGIAGLTRPDALIPRLDPTLTPAELQTSYTKVAEIVAEPIVSRNRGFNLSFPGLGLRGSISGNPNAASYESFEVIPQERLDELKVEIKKITGYEGELKLLAPTYSSGPGYNGPREPFEHLLLVDGKDQRIGVFKFTQPVEVKFIPQVDFPIKEKPVNFSAEPTIGGMMGLSRPESLIPQIDPKRTSDELKKSYENVRKLVEEPIISRFGETVLSFSGLGSRGTFNDNRDGVSYSSFNSISQERLDELKDEIRKITGYVGPLSLLDPQYSSGVGGGGPRQPYQHLLLLGEKERPIGTFKFTHPIEVKFIPQVEVPKKK